MRNWSVEQDIIGTSQQFSTIFFVDLIRKICDYTDFILLGDFISSMVNGSWLMVQGAWLMAES